MCWYLSYNISFYFVDFVSRVKIAILKDILVERLLLKIYFSTSLSTVPHLLELSLYNPIFRIFIRDLNLSPFRDVSRISGNI